MNHPNPCYGCKKRQIGCHASCAQYLAFDSENKKRREAAISSEQLTRYGIKVKRKYPVPWNMQ
ncbi:MAG: hypothetical protein N2376_09705 [Clostridia bacterium]|nr:hypothetical protein [Clostridia bacterium]